MIVVLGSVLARPEALDELRRISLEHVHRSRAEPGCISHAVHADAENPLRLVFVEKWKDAAALAAHFRVAESIAFAGQARALGAEPPVIEIFKAQAAKIG
jgi:quinol monooxygenase YgiN